VNNSIAKSKNQLNVLINALVKKYGKIFRIRTLRRNFVVVSDAAGIKQILTSASFARTAIFQLGVKVIVLMVGYYASRLVDRR
jgi:cytochrome P450